MSLPKSFTKFTPLSKTIALLIFIIFPFVGFYLGMKYQKLITIEETHDTAVLTDELDRQDRKYTFPDIGLQFVAPSEMEVSGNMVDDNSFTLYIQRSAYPKPDYYQFYGLYRFVPTTDADIQGVKADLDPSTIRERKVSGFKAVQGQYKGQRNQLVTFIFTDKGIFTISTAQPTTENGILTDKILDSFRF